MADGASPGVVPDLTDPCERYKFLNDAYLRSISGGQEELVRYRSNEVERELRFSKIDNSRLLVEMRQAERECQIKNGIEPTRRRMAIQAGSRRY